jgi:hypothetical protein
MSKPIAIPFPNEKRALIIKIPESATDNPLTPIEELAIALYEELSYYETTPCYCCREGGCQDGCRCNTIKGGF